MYLNGLIQFKKHKKFLSNRLLKLWHNEVAFKSIAVIILVLTSLLMVIYSSLKIRNPQNTIPNVLNLLGWLGLLLYCGLLIDLESSKIIKICFLLILMVNFVCIQEDYLIVGVIVDCLTFGVLFSIFKCDTKLYSKENDEEYLLPLINDNRKIFNTYYELWGQDGCDSGGYNGLIVTKCMSFSCLYIGILFTNLFNKYTDYYKEQIDNINDTIKLKATALFKTERKLIHKTFPIIENSEITFVNIILITFIILLKTILIRFIYFFNWKYLVEKPQLEIKKEQKLRESSLVLSQIKDNDSNSAAGRIKVEGNIQVKKANRKYIKTGFFFIVVFLFGLLTFNNQEFDITTNLFLVNQDSAILLCILLPLIGLISELSIIKHWYWYSIVTLGIYNINILLNYPIFRNLMTLVAGILFNISVTCFISNYKNESHINEENKYYNTLYILHKISYLFGNRIGRFIFLSGEVNGIVNLFRLIISAVIIICTVLINFNSISQGLCQKHENELEVEWDVTF
ncbi:putative integral membrane protein [Cryptosporidium felis]|nr:putative integral membrane protein [Cryptosporidium felis]